MNTVLIYSKKMIPIIIVLLIGFLLIFATGCTGEAKSKADNLIRSANETKEQFEVRKQKAIKASEEVKRTAKQIKETSEQIRVTTDTVKSVTE